MKGSTKYTIVKIFVWIYIILSILLWVIIIGGIDDITEHGLLVPAIILAIIDIIIGKEIGVMDFFERH